MNTKVDYIAVGRKVHELVAAHGEDGALRYAARTALEAEAEGDVEAFAFWRGVERTITPR
jgi:hypothetical protein